MIALSAFQLTHSRGVRPDLYAQLIAEIDISTHALTWSATQLYYWHLADQIISTHALTWSATIYIYR